MNWDDLRLLLQVSRNPRLEDAAARLGHDATTISRRLRRLEKNLGVTLFERTRRGHLLTSEGQEIALRAEKIEQSALEIAAFADAGDQLAAGRVRLGLTEGLSNALIAPQIGRFSQMHPLIDLDLIAMSGFVSVPKREADMSVMLTRPQTGRLKVRKLTDYVLNLYASPSYLASHPPIEHADALKEHRLIGYVDDLIYSPQLRYYDEVLPGLALGLCSPSIVCQYQMTRAGAGIAILPRFMAHEDPGLVPLLPETVRVERSFWLVIHEDVHPLARIRAMTDFLVALMAEKQSILMG
ncbi:MAG: LysR family transcriptional regulator [Neomegalonema sp.]|nr:LysR family transcriptional regulator [Neomegalonema sp.]